jgi:membrane-bound lytic murein transglycosylase
MTARPARSASPLTPERSIAVDPRYTPLGAPVFLATSQPDSPTPLRRLVLAQDTGGAIRGVVRADLFWGFGTQAGHQAGRMKQQGRCGFSCRRRRTKIGRAWCKPVHGPFFGA